MGEEVGSSDMTRKREKFEVNEDFGRHYGKFDLDRVGNWTSGELERLFVNPLDRMMLQGFLMIDRMDHTMNMSKNEPPLEATSKGDNYSLDQATN